MDWKASLLGANIVRSGAVSSVEAICGFLLTAPTRAVRPAACAVVETFWGGVRTVSMIWTMPPVKFVSYQTM